MKQIITDTLNGLAVMATTTLLFVIMFALPIWLFTQTWMLVVWFTLVTLLFAWMSGWRTRRELGN